MVTPVILSDLEFKNMKKNDFKKLLDSELTYLLHETDLDRGEYSLLVTECLLRLMRDKRERDVRAEGIPLQEF
jgi:hypothetical protein